MWLGLAIYLVVLVIGFGLVEWGIARIQDNHRDPFSHWGG